MKGKKIRCRFHVVPPPQKKYAGSRSGNEDVLESPITCGNTERKIGVWAPFVRIALLLEESALYKHLLCNYRRYLLFDFCSRDGVHVFGFRLIPSPYFDRSSSPGKCGGGEGERQRKTETNTKRSHKKWWIPSNGERRRIRKKRFRRQDLKLESI